MMRAAQPITPFVDYPGEIVSVFRTPFGCNAQDLLPEDRPLAVLVGTFDTSAAATAWINAQAWPTDFYVTWSCP